MSNEDVSINNEAFSFRMSGINIEKFISLNNGIGSNNEKVKNIMKGIFSQNISDNQRAILEKLIDACKCKEYTSTRFHPLFQRTVIKDTHLQ